MTGRAVLTNSYAVIPRECQRDIVTSLLPHWSKTRAWILARPLSGFAETFSQYVVECEPGATGSDPSPGVESVLFGLDGDFTVHVNDNKQGMTKGSFAYLPPDVPWSVTANEKATFTWIRKLYESVQGIDPPSNPVFTHDDLVEPTPMPDTNGAWATTRFLDPSDLAYDMHVNIVSFQPGAVIPFKETHVMEHGILILQGKAVYHLNTDWVEVQQGDFLWLRAFCPQSCYAGGPNDFRYLLYKDVNRHPTLSLLRR